MSSHSLRFATILAAVFSTHAWADDVKPAGPTAAVSADINDQKLPYAGPTYNAQLATIIQDCGVEEQNRDQLRDLLRTWDADTYAIMSEAAAVDPSLMEKLAGIDKELAAANEKTDPNLIRDMNEKRKMVLEAMGGWSDDLKGRIEALDSKYSGAVRELVAPGKTERLDEILNSVQDGQPNRPRRAPVRSPRALQAITDRLSDLTPDQRSRIDAAFLKFRNAQRAAANKPQTEEANTTKLYDEVFAILTDGQKTRVEQELRGRNGGAAQPESGKPAAPGAGSGAATEKSDKPGAVPTPPPVKDAAKKP